MHDALFHQAVGLQQLMSAVSPRPRMIAVTASGDRTTELALLWQLTTELNRLGGQVLVLDGTAFEDKHNPGLVDTLEQNATHPPDLPPSAMQIWPAAMGLQRLVNLHQSLPGHQHPVLARWLERGVILVYAPAETLAQLITHGDIHPLVVSSLQPQRVIDAYQSLKTLVQGTRLRPQVLTAIPRRSDAFLKHAVRINANLRRCAAENLDMMLETQTVVLDAAGDQHTHQEIRSIALRMLENTTAVSAGDLDWFQHPGQKSDRESSVWSH